MERGLAVAQDEGELLRLIQALPCAAMVESDGRIVACNTLASEMSGLPAGALIASEQIFLGSYPFAKTSRKTDASHDAVEEFRCVLLCRDGKPIAIQGALRLLQTMNGPRRLVIVLERVANSQSTGEDTFLAELLDAAPEGMAITHNGNLVHVNREFTRLFGYPAASCLGREIDSLLMPADRMHETEQLYHLIASEGRAAMDTVRLTSEGDSLDVSVLTGPVKLGGDAYGLFHTFRDIRPQKEAHAKLHHSAMHDALTSLPNRKLFLERLEVARTRLHRRPSRTFGVLFLDLDGFKPVNDTLGHAAGDELLLRVAEVLKDCVRPQDTVARLGGDEFAILLDDTDSEQSITNFAQRVQAAISAPIRGEAGEMNVSASMGSVFVTSHHTTARAMLHHADVAMYYAKHAGKACHRAYNTGMTMLAKAG
jgi:diguanylate cyclase (GGDEF)-like protein/PAS domain S-box-containing protein